MSDLSDFLRITREGKGMRQTDLAAKTGLSDTYIANIERGKQRGAYNTLVKIARALDLPPDRVLSRAGFQVLEVSEGITKLELEDHQFQRLQPPLKKALLEFAPILWKYIKKS